MMDPQLVAEIKREILNIRCELAWRRLKWAFQNLERACRKANFNPAQPRVPRGSSDGGQWTDAGGGFGSPTDASRDRSTGRAIDLVYRPDEDGGVEATPAGARGRTSVGVRVGRFEFEATPAQAIRLTFAEAWAQNEIARVREIDPTWRPRPSLVETAEGLIRAREGEAEEARARYNELARGMGDNGGPPLDRLVDTSPIPSQIMSTYRAITGMPQVRSGVALRKYEGTIAYMNINGRPIIGVNSDAPGYTVEDEEAAQEMRARLVELYPGTMATRNLGHKPNDALYHAEANALLRAYRSGVDLAGRTVEIRIDRRLCSSCEAVLPLIGAQLGNPSIRIVEPDGVSISFENGQ